MLNLKITKHGYDVNEVESYINNMVLKYNSVLSEQKERVISQKKELDEIKQQLTIFQNKEKEITNALISAQEKAKELEDSSKQLYDYEVKRINNLYNNWEKLLADCEKKYLKSDEYMYIYKKLAEFRKEIVNELENKIKPYKELTIPNTTNNFCIKNIFMNLGKVFCNIQ